QAMARTAFTAKSRQPRPITSSQTERGQLWERACSRWHQPATPDGPSRPHREQDRSHNSAFDPALRGG
ncbi:hypothetical protein F0169_11990, partial [Pseudomonas sp. MAFF 212408]|nr:hypothetical protein [Pseudomonas kitaguniensis]